MTTWISDNNGNRCSGSRRLGIEILRDMTADCNDDCLEWKGYKDPAGYGRVWYEGRWQLAHRVAYVINCEIITPGFCILHQCDNPSCINPRHLSVGTQIANIRDRDTKGRMTHGRNHPRARISDADVLAIREDRRPMRTIAAQYGIAVSNISDIKNFKAWRHI